MKKLNHRRNHAAARQVHGIWQRHRKTVQNSRTVTVKNALRVASGARCIRQVGAGVFIKFRPLKCVCCTTQQFLIAKKMRQLAFRHLKAIGHHDDVPDRGTSRRNVFKQRQKGGVNQHHDIFCVLHRVAHLLNKQSRVHRMAHRAHARYRVVGFQVPVTRPCQRRYPLTRFDTQRQQGSSQALAPVMRIGIVGAVDLAIAQRTDNFN